MIHLLTIAAEVVGNLPLPVPTKEVGGNVWGISGLTPGSIAIVITGLFGIGVWYIRGMADRRRAANEGVIAGESVTQAQFLRMEAEIARLSKRVVALETENLGLHTQIHELRNEMAGCPVPRGEPKGAGK